LLHNSEIKPIQHLKDIDSGDFFKTNKGKIKR